MTISLRQQLNIGLGIIVAGLVTLLLTIAFSVISSSQAAQRLIEHDRVLTDEQIPLERDILAIKLDVVQVQQWLTNISATRGQSGLDDGFDHADGYAASFQQHLMRARERATRLGLTELVSALDAAAVEFAPYYETGRRMAQAYIDGGPAQGNILMREFDVTGARMSENVTAMVSLADALALASRAAAEEARRATERVTTYSIMFAGIAVLLCFAAITLFALKGHGSVAAVKFLADRLDAATAGEMNARVLGISRTDEIGSMQRAFNRLMDMTELFVRDAGAAMLASTEHRYSRRILPDGMQGGFLATSLIINHALGRAAELDARFGTARETFETEVRGGLELIRTSSSNLADESRSLIVCIESTVEGTRTVVQASNAGAQNVNMVASATEELTSSIQEICRQVEASSAMVRDSADEAGRANAQILALKAAADRIGDIVEMITQIAEQTNLLALNATIEAARAGESGRGFAVVAQEVKALASQTGGATEDVRRQVANIQEETAKAVKALESIAAKANGADQAIAAVAAAMEEQQAATRDIASNIEGAASEVSRINEAIDRMALDVSKTQTSAQVVVRNVDDVRGSSLKTDEQVQNFVRVMGPGR